MQRQLRGCYNIPFFATNRTDSQWHSHNEAIETIALPETNLLGFVLVLYTNFPTVKKDISD